MAGTSAASAARRRSIDVLLTGETRHIIGGRAPSASQFRRRLAGAALSASTDSIESVGSGDILPQTVEITESDETGSPPTSPPCRGPCRLPRGRGWRPPRARVAPGVVGGP